MGERLCDLVVVGAGPAGAAAALAAVRHAPWARVVLLDKAAFPRDKACGDGIAPHAADQLRLLGTEGALDGYEPVDRLRIRGPNGRPEVVARLRRPSHVVPRRVFDAHLVDAAQRAGVELRRQQVRRLTQRRDRVVVDGDLAGRVLVAADGANSTIRRILGVAANRPEHLAVAVRGYAAIAAGPREQLIAFVAEGWPAYSWSFPVDRQHANVGYGLLRSRFSGGKAELHERLRALLPAAEPDPATLRAHHLPMSTWRPTPAQGRVLLAGDAASLVNPLSGEGIFYALSSGRLAGITAVTAPDAPARAYQLALRRLLSRHLRHTGVLARLIRHPPFVTAALRAAATSPAVHASMVELALGLGTMAPGVALSVAGAYARSGLPRRGPPGRDPLS